MPTAYEPHNVMTTARKMPTADEQHHAMLTAYEPHHAMVIAYAMPTKYKPRHAMPTAYEPCQQPTSHVMPTA